MFWLLYLAHFLGDYPLQPGWLVEAKRNWPGLTLHVSIHLATMLVLVGSIRRLVWPYLLLLAALHFVIDVLKNLFFKYRPQWVAGPHLFDQFLHLLSILLVASLIQRAVPENLLPENQVWPVYAIGYLVATYVWFITERVLSYGDEGYQREVIAQLWPRMITRAVLVTVFLLGGQFLLAAVPAAAATVQIPYVSGTYGRRALVTDLCVALVMMLFIQLAT